MNDETETVWELIQRCVRNAMALLGLFAFSFVLGFLVGVHAYKFTSAVKPSDCGSCRMTPKVTK